MGRSDVELTVMSGDSPSLTTGTAGGLGKGNGVATGTTLVGLRATIPCFGIVSDKECATEIKSVPQNTAIASAAWRCRLISARSICFAGNEKESQTISRTNNI
jgi:hypothetical protein